MTISAPSFDDKEDLRTSFEGILFLVPLGEGREFLGGASYYSTSSQVEKVFLLSLRTCFISWWGFSVLLCSWRLFWELGWSSGSETWGNYAKTETWDFLSGFGQRLWRVKLGFRNGNSEAASHLNRVGDMIDLGAIIKLRAGDVRLARSFTHWKVGGRRRLTKPECLQFLL